MNELQFLLSLLKMNPPEELKNVILTRCEGLAASPTPEVVKFSYWGETLTGLKQRQDTCEHDYDYVWGSTTPQPCKKCGKQVPSIGYTLGRPFWDIDTTGSSGK